MDKLGVDFSLNGFHLVRLYTFWSPDNTIWFDNGRDGAQLASYQVFSLLEMYTACLGD
jgi:hypothetical protein